MSIVKSIVCATLHRFLRQCSHKKTAGATSSVLLACLLPAHRLPLYTHVSSMSASQHSSSTTSSKPSPRGLVWPSPLGGSKQEYLGAAFVQPIRPSAIRAIARMMLVFAESRKMLVVGAAVEVMLLVKRS